MKLAVICVFLRWPPGWHQLLELKSKQHSRKVKIQSGTLQKEDLKQTNITMPITSGYQPNVSWFCHLWKKDKMIDMVLCNQCLRYVHEEGEGLTKNDVVKSFICTL